MFRLITSREEYKLRPRFRNPSPTIPGLGDFGLPSDYFYHLDANDAVQGATSWTSKEGKVFTSTTITKTASGINGLPTINASNHFWDVPSGGVTQPDGMTVFVVGTLGSSTNYLRLISQARATGPAWNGNAGHDSADTTGSVSLLTLPNGVVGTYHHTSTTSISTVAYTLNTPTLWVSRRASNYAVTNYAYRSGAAPLIGTTQTTNAVTAAFTRFGVGRTVMQAVTAENWSGQVAEVIYYNRHLSNAEFEAVRNFLNGKYSLAPVVQIPTDYFFHLDANDAVQGATTWTSKDGKVFTSSTITKNNFGMAGLPTVQSNYHYFDVGAGFTQPDGATVFVVGRTPSTSANLRFLSMAPLNTLDYFAAGNSSSNYAGYVPFHTFSGSQVGALWAYKSPATISPVSFATNTNTLWTSHRVGNQLTTYSNTAAGVTAGTTQTSNSVTATFNRVAIGTQPYQLGSDGMGGEVAEVIMYNRPLSTTELANVRTYLAIKYGLAY